MGHTVEEILNAIQGSKGVVSRVARNLGVNPRIINSAINTYPEVAFAMVQEKENTLDDMEEKLIEEADSGKAWAIKYYLDNQGHTRGYGVPAFSNAPKGFTLKVVYEAPQQIEEPTEDILAIEGTVIEQPESESEGSEDTPQEAAQETSGISEESIQEEGSSGR